MINKPFAERQPDDLISFDDRPTNERVAKSQDEFEAWWNGLTPEQREQERVAALAEREGRAGEA